MKFIKNYPKHGQHRICKKFLLMPYYGYYNQNRITMWLETVYYIQKWDIGDKKWYNIAGSDMELENALIGNRICIVNISKNHSIPQLTAMLNGCNTDYNLARGILFNVKDILNIVE